MPPLKTSAMSERTFTHSVSSYHSTDGSSVETNEDSSTDENMRTIADSTTSSYSLAFGEGEDVLWRSQVHICLLSKICFIGDLNNRHSM